MFRDNIPTNTAAPCIQSVGISLLALTSAEILSVDIFVFLIFAFFMHEIILICYESFVFSTIAIVFICHLITGVIGTSLLGIYPDYIILFFCMSITLIITSAILLILYNNHALCKKIITCDDTPEIIVHKLKTPDTNTQSYTNNHIDTNNNKNTILQNENTPIPINDNNHITTNIDFNVNVELKKRNITSSSSKKSNNNNIGAFL